MLNTLPSITTWAPAVATSHKNSAIAVLLSVLFPGLGHLYCGKRSTAMWTMGYFAVGLAVFLFVSAAFGLNLLTVYIFSAIDSLYTAWEANAGRDHISGENPRIAVTLNLILPGAGYFYIGNRMAGFLCIVAVRLVAPGVLAQRALVSSSLVLAVALGMAAHVYVLCKRQGRIQES